MPALRRNAVLAPFATVAAGLALQGCHSLPPPPVAFPPPPPLVCPVPAPVGGVCAESAVDEPQPIDLATALRLANVQNPEIAVARERIREALAVQDRAEMLWLPNVEFGANWTRHDGTIQRATGEVPTVSRSALFVGGGPNLNMDLGEALFAPLAARQLTEARRAGAAAATNERLLDVAVAYLELLQASVETQIVDEAYSNARHLLDLTESHEKAGTGRAADTARARTELNIRVREQLEAQGRVAVASARLARLLFLSPQILLRPVEPALVPVRLVAEDLPLPELIGQALAARPELAENRAVILAALQRWRAARVSPFVPTLRLGVTGGGFGGGRNSHFGNFDGRSDAVALAQWELLNLGLGDLAVMRERESRYAQAVLQQHGLAATVATQVVAAYQQAAVLQRELTAAQEAVRAAAESYRQNEIGVRRAPAQFRPIELLQALQALTRARQDYLRVVVEYNRAQFRLFTALGTVPLCAMDQSKEIPVAVSTVPPRPPAEAGPQQPAGSPAKEP